MFQKNERSKLDVKTKQCIFIGYGQDEFGYRFYDPIDKKLIRSRDAVFFEDQTIEDIDKVEKPDSQIDESLVDVDPVPIIDTSFAHEGTQDNEQGVEPIDVPIGDVVVDHQPTNAEMTNLDAPETSCRRSTREKRSSTRYSPNEYILLTDMGEPEGYDEVMLDTHRDRWVEAMEDEMKSLHENGTYELVELPKGKKALTNKWIFRLKQEQHTSAPRYKARLVVKGFGQRKGIDFDEIFSPVVKMSSIRMVLALAASLDLEVEQMDVKTVFLHGDLEEEIYMEQPEGFIVKG